MRRRPGFPAGTGYVESEMLKQGLMLAAATLALAACNGRSAERTASDTTAPPATRSATGSAMANAGAEMAPASAMATPPRPIRPEAGDQRHVRDRVEQLAQSRSKSKESSPSPSRW